MFCAFGYEANLLNSNVGKGFYFCICTKPIVVKYKNRDADRDDIK